ncbi:MAG: type I-U CRISPR-associated protein Csb2 [Halothiobacillaceae bacterium]|jgi:CRISPR-associated protein Csb2|nr:type I-U CRISPR-associated protein Csb2 [Halothiobacillaceae bacterium]MDY0049359.1 type I-U CRISPR-associated protein Csb2 [Halothiobacillaceae bacterium]
MALALEIEYLGGVCFSAISPDSEEPDWPPQPDRVFSALVATWGTHGGLKEAQSEREALEWLERQLPPMYEASDADARTTPSVFVPPNDPRTDKAKNAAGVLPAMRSRQPRRFPAARPHDPIVRYIWNEEPDEDAFNALDRLARDTPYVGHSSSLTRCRFTRMESPSIETMREPKRRVYEGRLKELCESHARFVQTADKKDRPRPGAPMTAKPQTPESRRNVFSDRWLVLEHVGGEMPDMRAAAIVARGIRTALMSGYGQIGEAIPAVVSGHEDGGSPARAPHMAVVPLSFTGFAHADGRVLGFALVPPTSFDLLEDETFRKVLRKLAPLNDDYGRRVLEVKSVQGAAANQSFALKFSPSFEVPPSFRSSLKPAIYTDAACRFATVTPIVLDRYLKKQGEARIEEISELVAAACERISLPRPIAVFPDKHSALQGAVSAYPSGRGPAWMNWRLPDSMAGRQLTHAVIEFSEPVEGPLLLGAGRFLGMGLCRSLGGEKG